MLGQLDIRLFLIHKMVVYFVLILLLNLFGFSLQSNQCQQKFVEEADDRYNFVVDCSNLGLESFPDGLSDLTTTLYLNGNRLKSINKASLDQLTHLEVLDLSANDITSLPRGIFDNNNKLKTVDLGRNRLHCDWSVWWLVNFTKTLESFNGFCFSPKSLRGRDIRRLTEKDVIVDCASKRKLNNQSRDGHYMFLVAGSGGHNIKLPIYCHRMDSDTPKEYLDLPSGTDGNFVSSVGAKSFGCLQRNVSSKELSQYIGFSKVRLILRSLMVIPDDLTFATGAKRSTFGSGRFCGIGNGSECIGADAMIDLRGTPFRIKDSVSWQYGRDKGKDVFATFLRKFGGAVAEIKCPVCGGCSLASSLLLEPMDTQLKPYEACTRPLGIQDGRIPASNITASSFLDRNFLPRHARLFNADRGGWCASTLDRRQFIQVDFGRMFIVSGITTQGYQSYNDWVTSYGVLYNAEDEIWKEYTLFGNPKIFRGNTDSNTVVTHWLDPRLRARSLRIRPLTWYNGDELEHRICLRFEVYGCENDVSSHVVKLGDSKPCILPESNAQNVTNGTKLVFDSKCHGTNFMFKLDGLNSLVHTISGLCLSIDENATAILTTNCRSNALEYQRITRGGTQNSNLIIKHTSSGKCVRFKREKKRHNIKVVLRKCGDISQILLILTKKGAVPMKPHFRVKSETRTADMWSTQLFTCSFMSDPRSIFAWSKGIPLMNGGIKLNGENFEIFQNGSLLIRNLTWDNRGSYFCNAMNSEGSETRLVELKVRAIQTFYKRPTSQETVVGRKVKFDCRVEGIPKPKILWKVRRHDSENLVRIDSLDQRRFKLLPNGTLVIMNIHFDDRGAYVCIAKSPGKKNNATAHLTVYVPPRITLSSQKKNLYVGEAARVTCHAIGEPYPKVAWYKVPELNNSSQRNLGLIDGNISFERVTKDDAGTYICSAKNLVGETTASFKLVVTATCNFIHTRYSNVTPKRSFFTEQQFVTVKCQKGFQLIGAARLQCTRFGNWSYPFPRCVDIDECNTTLNDLQESSGYNENLDTEPDVCHVNAICTNTIGSFRCACEEGYEGNGFMCNWRSTTTKAPTTIPTTATTTQKPVATTDRTFKESTRIKTTEERMTSTEGTESTTGVPYSPALWTVMFNYTQGLMSEFDLLSKILDHSRLIGNLPSMETKLQSLNVSLSALNTALAPRKQSLVSGSSSLNNLQMFSNVISSLLDDASTLVWKKRQENANGTSELLSVVDGYCRRLLKDWDTSSLKGDVEIVTRNIVVLVKDLANSLDKLETDIGIMSGSSPGTRVIFQKKSLENVKSSIAILIQYDNLERILKSSSKHDMNRVHLVSKVISLTVAGIKDGTTLKKPVRMEFGKQQNGNGRPECVFWKFHKLNNGGDWSNEGCRLYQSTNQNQSTQHSKKTVTCECDHLTNFAVIERRPINGARKGQDYFVLSLSLSVVIGCGISVFFAFTTCISHLCFSSHIRSDRRIIMINTCACILLSSGVFLGGALLSSFKLIKGDFTKYFCLVMSGSLQLFFLAFFSWMLAEAIQIFLSTRTVIDKGTGKLTMFYLLGWGLPTVMAGLSLMLILFGKVQITSWCWIDLSSYSHFLLTGIPVFTLVIITVILYAFISTSLKRNKDLLNTFVLRYTKFALWCSPILLILHILTILALAAFLSFNQNYVCHYVLGVLYGLEGVFLIVYQCYIEKMVLTKSGAMSPQRSKRQHSYSVKDTVTYGEETCIEDGNGKYLIRRPSKRSLQDISRASISVSAGIKGSRRSDLDQDSESNYFDMYGTSDRLSASRPSKRVPVVNEDDVDENGQLLKDDTTEDSNETASEPRETQLTSFDVNSVDAFSRKKGPSTCGSVISVETVNNSECGHRRKPSSTCGSVVSVETKSRHQIQGIPVYFPGSAPPQHMLTLERKKKENSESRTDSEEKYDNVDDDLIDDDDVTRTRDSKDSLDPDRMSNISNELTTILKELEAFSSDAATPSVPRKTRRSPTSNGHPNRSPIWQKRRPPYERQGNVEMTDIRFGTGSSPKTDWYGEVKDPGDGLHKRTDDLYTSF